jgi:two-component sensor histidine kinase
LAPFLTQKSYRLGNEGRARVAKAFSTGSAVRNIGRRIASYAAALIFVAAAMGVRFLLTSPLGESESVEPFYPAVLASAFLGAGPGALAAIVSIAVVWYFFVPPAWSFGVQDANAVWALLLFAVCSVLIVALAEAYRRVRTAHARADQLFKTVQDISLEGVVVYRAVRDGTGKVADLEYRYVNAAALAIMAKSDASEIVGRKLLERLPLAGQHPDLFPRYCKVLQTGAAAEAEYELGGRWFHSNVAKLEDGLVVTVQDISARRRSDERQTLLLQELNHRVKNVLASVIAMTTLTERGTRSTVEFKDKLLGRLHALARAHGLLSVSAWTNAAIDDVVRSTLEPYIQAEAPRFLIEGPPVSISSDVGLALNMALHELSTNAVKYGALSTAAGRIAIAWRFDPAEADFVILQWSESGGPPIDSPGAPGFGSRLLERALAAEGGRIALTFPRTGACCEMRFRGAHPKVRAAAE